MAGISGDCERRLWLAMMETGEALGIRMTVLHRNGCCALAPPTRWQRLKSFFGKR